MKRVFIALMLALFAIGQVSAQMTDEEVALYAKEQYDAGKSETAILVDLQKKGVTREQLLRIRDKYEAMQASGTGSKTATAASSSDNDRMREANGETKAVEVASSIDTKRIFGHDIFQNKDLSFEPNMNIATPANYILGPGDEVLVDVYGTSQSSKKYNISPEGTIIVEKIGPVSISGLTIDQAQAKITSKMGQHYQGSSIKVTAGQTRTVIINILGEVANPGTYTLSAFATVFNALYLAGGITEIGTLRNIKVCRNGRTISKVDVYDFILNGKLTGNIMLQDNDAIIVDTYTALVRINGAVKRPMFYEMKEGETLNKIIEYAGGYTSVAKKNVVNVERKTDDGPTVHTVDEFDYATFSIQDGDIVEVKGILDRYQNMVQVSGSVFYPGHYSLNNDCNSIRTLVEKAGGVKEAAFVNRAVLFRLNENRTRHSISIDLENILTGKTPDVILENEDSLVIASDEDNIKARKYHIYGQVTRPGVYQYVEGMTLEDAIVAAGGLKEEALHSDIEIARHLQYTDEHDTTYTKKAKIYTFNVDSGLLVTEGQSFSLKPSDVITVKRNPEYTDVATVQITGEVKYPGIYSLLNKNERLSDLIKRAGGLTDAGFTDGMRLSRIATPEEKERARQLHEIANGADTVNAKKIVIKDKYLVGADLAKALKNPGGDDDIILHPGDQIDIPQCNNTVRISGEVLYPNTVGYIEGKSVNYYINQAGGVNINGLRGKAFIIYANGQVSRSRYGRIQPGCEIVVPTKKKKEVDAQKISMITAGVATLSTIGAILISALRR